MLLSYKIGINVNGEIRNWISYRLGLRQGKMVSLLLFLFILTMEPLHRMLNASAYAKIFEGMGNPWISRGIKLLQYAGDTLIFFKSKEE